MQIELVKNVPSEWFPKLLEINNQNVPKVSLLTGSTFADLASWSDFFWAVAVDENPAGFIMVLSKNKPYKSEHYGWVSQNYQNFLYLDRVVVGENFRRLGVASLLYRALFKELPAAPLVLEVNTRPPSEASLSFHEKLGFTPVFERENNNGTLRVRYYEYRQHLQTRPASI